jgi:rhamnose utilization protein RhaD (predicted bifunctional aldolase and dehydrogenase)
MSRRLSIANSKRTDQKSAQIRGSTSSFSVIPLLLAGQSISPEARQALRENRLKDAAVILMEEYGLSCDEAGNLLNITVC